MLALVLVRLVQRNEAGRMSPPVQFQLQKSYDVNVNVNVSQAFILQLAIHHSDSGQVWSEDTYKVIGQKDCRHPIYNVVASFGSRRR